MTQKFDLAELDCADCAARPEREFDKPDLTGDTAPKVNSVETSAASGAVGAAVPGEVAVPVEGAVPVGGAGASPVWASSEIREVLILGVGFVLLIFGIIFEAALASTPGGIARYALFLGLWAAGGRNVLASAVRNILRGRIFDENFLMSIATVGAIIVGALPEAAGVMIFFNIGEFFQDRAVRDSRRQIRALLDIKPEFAMLETGSGYVRVDPRDVPAGSTIMVRPGEKVPLDGVIVTGRSRLDTSALTGESLPREAGTEEAVLAGMISLTGLLVIQTTRPYGESAVARILNLVENATNRKAKTERFFSTFARHYTPAVVGIALATAFLPPILVPGESLSEWVYRALIMLVISCPCALVVSIPLAYFGGLGAASKNGILIKGSDYLDALGRVGAVILDKTGTISSGKFRVAEIANAEGFSKEDVLELAAQAEAHSNHPIALSIRESCRADEDCRILPDASEYEELGGLGVRALVPARADKSGDGGDDGDDGDDRAVREGSGTPGREGSVRQVLLLAGNERMMRDHGIEPVGRDMAGSVVHVAVDGRYAGHLVIMDTMKEDSAESIAELRASGVGRIAMLTGDNEGAAAYIAGKAGITEYRAGLLPEDKVAIFEKIAEEEGSSGSAGKRRLSTIFVGDGINDAPVLARADIGISMGGAGSEAAIETSDVVIMGDSLRKIPVAIRIAKKTRSILFQNIAFALGVKGLFIVLGFLGLASMWEAVFGDVGVALIAVLNSTRAMGRRSS